MAFCSGFQSARRTATCEAGLSWPPFSHIRSFTICFNNILLYGAAFGAAIGMATGAAVGAGLHFAHVLAVGTAAAAALDALTWVALSQNFEPGRAESGAKHAKRH